MNWELLLHQVLAGLATGGIYACIALAIDLEANQVARWLHERGIAAFVLKYRLQEKKGEGIPPDLNMDEACKYGIADGIHLDRSILKLILRNKTSERVSLISDAIAATGLGDGEYQIWGETIVVKNGRTQNSKGSIAGSVITMARNR